MEQKKVGRDGAGGVFIYSIGDCFKAILNIFGKI